jgi:ADP-ribosyl-[dinitrogen reductase] hydrolase
VWIGGALPLDDLPKDIDAVVGLYRVGTQQVPAHVVSHAVRLIDTVAEDNPNVELVIDAAARTVLRLRDQGKQVYLHCVAAHSRTPTVAARVAALEGHGLDDALKGVVNALPSARPERWLIDALRRLAKQTDGVDAQRLG